MVIAPVAALTPYVQKEFAGGVASIRKIIRPLDKGRNGVLRSRMTALEKAKAATAALAADEQYELFRWWVESDSFRQRQLAALKQDIAVGIEQLDNGRYQTFADSDVMQLADNIARSGRIWLQTVRWKE